MCIYIYINADPDLSLLANNGVRDRCMNWIFMCEHIYAHLDVHVYLYINTDKDLSSVARHVSCPPLEYGQLLMNEYSCTYTHVGPESKRATKEERERARARVRACV